jgi:uncharacterized damage-inducible protein DinB
MSTPSPIERKPWFSRTFAFDLEPWMMPNVVERLRGTAARLEERIAGLPRDVLTRPSGPAKWTVQENAGHLLDLESLWSARLDETLAGAPALTAADLTNAKTREARHDEHDVASILRRFREDRGRWVAKLDSLDAAQVVLASHHPRLKVPMRVIDQAFFVAEHDDHHLARITEILAGFR